MTAATLDELLIWTLARQARQGDVVVVGVATPIATASALLARELLVPDLTVIAAAAVQPTTHDIVAPMLDPGLLDRLAVGTLGQSEILDQIQKGLITLQYVSPAQVDGAGRLNTSRVRRSDGSWLRLPGGLATADIAVLMGRLVAYRADHGSRFLTAEVDFVNGAGHDGGREWRSLRRLPGSGLQTIVTGRAVIDWTDRGFALTSVHEGSTVAEVVDGCGFPLQAIEEPVQRTPAPPPEALDLLRNVIDPHGIRRLEVKETRAAALAELRSLSKDAQ